MDIWVVFSLGRCSCTRLYPSAQGIHFSCALPLTGSESTLGGHSLLLCPLLPGTFYYQSSPLLLTCECGMVSHCEVNLQFPDCQWGWAILYVYWPFGSLLWWSAWSSVLPILGCLFIFLLIWCGRFFRHLRLDSLIIYIRCKYLAFLTFSGVLGWTSSLQSS